MIGANYSNRDLRTRYIECIRTAKVNLFRYVRFWFVRRRKRAMVRFRGRQKKIKRKLRANGGWKLRDEILWLAQQWDQSGFFGVFWIGRKWILPQVSWGDEESFWTEVITKQRKKLIWLLSYAYFVIKTVLNNLSFKTNRLSLVE